ncbi:MAG TPA: TonB family protein [Gammaproteobacteria bacterium]
MMKVFLQSTWFRFLASGVIAGVFVIAVVGTAIRFYTPSPEDPLLSELEQVRIVSVADNPALAEAIRREREKHQGVLPEPVPPPPPLRPEREISGFVQLEYTINPDGSVSDVRVVGSAPSGVYEDQAVAEVSRSMHAPAFNDAGEAVPRRTTEIVEFTVPASQLSDQ